MNARFKPLIGILAVVLGVAAGATAEDPATDAPALIIVDIQQFYFEDGLMPLDGSLEAARAAHRVLERFRANGWPVIHVQHLPEGRSEPGQDVEPEAYRIRPEVAPKPGEVVIGKHFANAFRDTRLEQEIQRMGVETLVIVGMQTHMCLEATTRAAADLGYQVTVLGDACATRDLSYGGTTVPAALVHASTLASLQGAYAKVETTEEFLADAR